MRVITTRNEPVFPSRNDRVSRMPRRWLLSQSIWRDYLPTQVKRAGFGIDMW
jgi:hypothetical protein